MKLNELINFEMDKDKKSSLQVKAVKALVAFLILMFLLTLLSRAADAITIAKVTVTTASGGTIDHDIKADGTISSNKDVAVATSAGVKIGNVAVTEGTSVKEGDLLFELDMTDLEKQLLTAQNELDQLKAAASDKNANEAIQAAAAEKSLQRIYEDYNTTVTDAQSNVDDAYTAMTDALSAYNEYKNNSGNPGSTDDSVQKALEKTLEEKKTALEKAQKNLDGIYSDIEAAVQKEITAQGAKTQAEKQAIRDQVYALAENQRLIEDGKADVDDAQAEQQEASSALDTYMQEQQQSDDQTADEQLKTLYTEYTTKRDAYNEAVKQQKNTLRDANRTIEDAKTTETVDTASELSSKNDLELKQLAVDSLQKIKDADGKVYAPVGGLITKVQVTTGEATTEDTAVRIADQTSGYKFTASIDKTSAKYLSEDDEITLDIGNDKTVQGLKIASVTVSSEDKNTYNILVNIPSKVTGLGSMATMDITKSSKKYSTVVPLSVLHSENNNNYFVYVTSVTDSILGSQTTAEKVSVTILDKNSTNAAIEGNFTYDQQFIVSSSKTLRENDRVRLKVD